MKKIKGLILMLLIPLSFFGLTGCGEDTTRTYVDGYMQISAWEANMIISTKENYVIIDARTEEEFKEGHIKDAILIPEYEIAKRAEKELPDKDQMILVYCRSGRRSKIASKILAELGYTKVYEFGGIIDWPYDIVK